MKAYVLHGVNDLRYETVPDPVPGQNEVLVAVGNVGICGSDIPRIYQTGAHSHPLIPGHEFAGTAGIMIISVPEETAVLPSLWQCRRKICFPFQKTSALRRPPC